VYGRNAQIAAIPRARIRSKRHFFTTPPARAERQAVVRDWCRPFRRNTLNNDGSWHLSVAAISVVANIPPTGAPFDHLAMRLAVESLFDGADLAVTDRVDALVKSTVRQPLP
jgi:hypothetical protein